MIFKHLKFSNFKSFVGDHEFDFKNSVPGLYFITGENKVDVPLGSNGSGKSTLIDVIKWVLTGKTVRNLKAGDVHSRNVKGGTSAEITISLNDTGYHIFRSWSPNKLTIATGTNAPVTCTQDEIDQLLRLSEDDIHNSVIYGQFNTSFLDLQPTQMLSTFNGILNLDYWTDKSTLASTEKTKTQSKLFQAESKITTCKNKIEMLESNLVSTQSLADNFDTDKTIRLDELESKHSQLVEELESLPKLEVSKTISNTLGIKTAIKELRLVADEIRTEQNQFITKQAVCRSDLQRLRNEISKLQGLGGSCSVCGQSISGKHVDTETTTRNVAISTLEKQIASLDADISNRRALLSEAATALADEEARLAAETAKEAREAEKVSSQKAAKTILESKLDAVESEFNRLNDSQNPYTSKLESIISSITQEKDVLEALEGSLETINQELSAYDKWVKGFKDIRLLVIEQAITDLEVEVNNAISELGLSGWSIKFDIEKENKSGGVTKGFNVLVYSPTNSQPVPWAAWSGGEGQRLRLAATAGLSSLILSRRNVNPNCEFYDEPSKHMNKEGLTTLAEYLSNRARTLGKQIWLVDHNIPDFSGVTGTIKIIKDANGSRIE